MQRKPAMRTLSPIARLWLAALSALLAAAALAACSAPPSAVQPPAVDSAPLEDAARRVQAAADRIDQTAEQLETAPAPDTSQLDTLFSNADALRLLALLSQIEIELNIIDALIDPRPDSRPGQWPLEPETAAALGFTSRRLGWISFHLSEFIRSLTEPPPVFEDESITTMLTELQTELRLIRTSARELWQAHESGEPSVAPATRLTTVARTRIDRLIEAVSAFLAAPP